MKVLVAGATGAIGIPLIRCLQGAAESVIGIARSAKSAAALSNAGAESVLADALDVHSIEEAIRRVRPDVIINELTALPKHYTPEEMRNAAERDRTTRVSGNANLLSSARKLGVRRYILQSSAFWYAPGAGLADEAEAFAYDASPAIAAGARTYASLESSLAVAPELEAVVLRYGFFYGNGTWYTQHGDMAEQVRQRQVAVIGDGGGVWSFVHIDDAAAATAAALHCAPGVYNIVDDEPSQQRVWLPSFAHWLGAPEPPRITEEQGLRSVGADMVYYATSLRGASNARARQLLKFHARPLEWLHAQPVRS